MTPAYVAKTRLSRHARGVRAAELPIDGTVLFGLHSEIAENYALPSPDGLEPHAMTFDYLVAATGGCLIDHMGSALEARGFSATEDLTADVSGDVEEDAEGYLVVARIRVRYRLVVDNPDVFRGRDREKLERALLHHATGCPMYRTLCKSVDIVTELELAARETGATTAIQGSVPEHVRTT